MTPPQFPSNQTTSESSSDSNSNGSRRQEQNKSNENKSTIIVESQQDTVESPPQPESDRESPSTAPESKGDGDNKSKFKAALKKYWWVGAIALVLAGGVVILRPWEDAPEETPATEEVTSLSVRTAQATREPIRAWISSEGRVRAAQYQHLTFEVEGDVIYLASRDGRRLREGDFVTEGELLARVDDRELVADLQAAQAALAEARQQRAAAAANVAQAQARLTQLQTSRNLAQTQLERYQFLFEEGAVAAAELDTRTATLQESEANLQAAQAEVTAAQEQFQATQAQIDTAQARVNQAEVALEGASIYAPFDGVVAYLNYTEGEYFSPQIVTSQLGGEYQGILERIPMVVIDPSLYEVIVDLAGPTGELVRSGQPAFIGSEAIANSAGNPYSNLVDEGRARGEVFAVNPAINPGGRAIEARIRLDPETTENLRHGERILTWIAVEEDLNAIVVPLNAIVYRDQTPYVFVVNEEEMIEQRQVELGIRGLTRQQIISGVRPGELVVTQGQNRLVEGAPVRIVD